MPRVDCDRELLYIIGEREAKRGDLDGFGTGTRYLEVRNSSYILARISVEVVDSLNEDAKTIIRRFLDDALKAGSVKTGK